MDSDVIEIDGSMGEGGGQVLRTSLALSLLTSAPLRISGIRAGRAKPGLMRQHLLAVQAAATISGAELVGAELGSQELSFHPGDVRSGDYHFAINSAGSTTLVLQTVLLPLLLRGRGSSSLTFEGGTHNPLAPPFDFIDLVLLPLLARMGASVEVKLERHGFYPAGGGAWSARIEPLARLQRLELLERGDVRRVSATALCANLPGSVGVRQVEALSAALGWPRSACTPRMIQGPGPGNALLAVIESEHVTELISGFGARGVPAELVATRVADEARSYLEAGVPVGEHLADQLLLPMALAGGGALCTLEPSLHMRTQLGLLQQVLGVRSSVTQTGQRAFRVEVGAAD